MQIRAIDQYYKSHNAPIQYPTIHNSEQNVRISVLNCALYDMGRCI